MTTRIEISIFKNTALPKFEELFNTYNLVNVYIQTSLANLSETRKRLVELGYTTRLFIVLCNNEKTEYIYGKLKGQKGAFNEKCKNSVFRKPIEEVIAVSSNLGDTVLTDDPSIQENYNGENRQWLII